MWQIAEDIVPKPLPKQPSVEDMPQVF
jgi:hypothetical protein